LTSKALINYMLTGTAVGQTAILWRDYGNYLLPKVKC
jgi:hypothetical protein